MEPATGAGGRSNGMDRLTEHRVYSWDKSHGYDALGYGAIEQKPFFPLIKKLAEYEDSGLSPSEVAELNTKLAASQRRERAAVKDLKVNWLCRSCTKRIVGREWCSCDDRHFINGPDGVITCGNFDWRGPRAGKGEAE